MSRARRVEGNNLFGGRQKIYKIPVRPGDGSPDTEAGRRGMGKAVYEHDINMSAFQRLRLKEKEERAEAAARESGYAASTASSNISKGTYSSGTSGHHGCCGGWVGGRIRKVGVERATVVKRVTVVTCRSVRVIRTRCDCELDTHWMSLSRVFRERHDQRESECPLTKSRVRSRIPE